MSTVRFSTSIASEHVDTVNGVIRGVSVITSGLIARGHDLEVDGVTLDQMQKCAESKGQVPVKVDHKSGAAAVCGYLCNFHRDDNKLKADWHLLKSHPQREQILEVAHRMPKGVGLSASFVSPENGERGKARCSELISVDYVTLPAANPDGMFSRKDVERPLSGVERVHRVIGAAGHGAEIGAVGGLAARALLRRRGLTSDASAATGALIGGLAAGAYQWRRDSKPRDFAARVADIYEFNQEAALRRLTEAVSNNVSVPVPGAEQASTVARLSKKPFIRRAAVRVLKIGAGAGLGYYAGKRVGAKTGAIVGTVAGALFENTEARGRVRLSINYAKKNSL